MFDVWTYAKDWQPGLPILSGTDLNCGGAFGEELVRAYGEAFGQGAPQPRARALCAQRQPDPAATESMRPVITRVLEPDMTCEEALAATDRVAEL